MNITINSTTTILQIQDNFSKQFPFLKVEFFTDSQKPLIAENLVKDHEMEIGKLATKEAAGTIEMNGNTVVKQLEDSCISQFGLALQVFHKRGNSWILTTTSDNATLADLNNKAEEDNMPLPKTEIADSADAMDLE